MLSALSAISSALNEPSSNIAIELVNSKYSEWQMENFKLENETIVLRQT